jgi:NitT/TauT family transport system substrate-binding protein
MARQKAKILIMYDSPWRQITMKIRYCSLLTSIFAITVATLLFTTGCSPKQETPPPAGSKPAVLEKLAISYGGPLPSLLAIAADQGFFTRDGLDVTIKDVILGKNAFEDMLAGKSDFAIVAETPVVVTSFTRDDFQIVATLATTDNLCRIVMRRDRNLDSVTALKGRRVATVKGVVPHYFLDLVLARNGLNEKDIVTVFLETDKLGAALVDGSVDAIAATSNIAQDAMKKLGEKGRLLEEPGLCLTYTVLVTSKTYAATYPERVDKLIKALHATDRFRQQDANRSREIVMSFLKISQEEYDTVWGKYAVRLALDSALLLTMEEHANWALHKGFVKGERIPNYLDFIETGPLKKVSPEAVRLKR